MYKFILAFRFLLKRRISYFSLFAVALCVFVVLIVITVLNGLTVDFERKTKSFSGDCIISSKSLVGFCYYDEFVDILKKDKNIKAVAPVIRNYAIVKDVPADKGARFFDRTLEVIAAPPADYNAVSGFSKWLYYKKEKKIENVFQGQSDVNLPGCVMGIGTVYERDSKGNYVLPQTLSGTIFNVGCFPLTAKGALVRAATDIISSKNFILSDVAQSGVRADWSTIYLPFDQAQLLCGMAGDPKRVNAIFIKFTDGVDLKKGTAAVDSLWRQFTLSKQSAEGADLFKNVRVQTWKNYNREMVSVAETQQGLMILLFFLMGIITVFIVFVVFYMVVSHKSKDIGILKSIGISNAGIMSLFLYFAFLTGLVASGIGSFVGWQFLVHINRIEAWLFHNFNFQLWDRKIYAIGDIPNRIDLTILFVIILSAIAACLIGAFIPSRYASKKEPVQALQVSKL
jgi:ABC-type lipoprotein release transport system permease subunit